MKLIGHEKIVDDLKALAAGGTLSHGYLFYGSAMTGKRAAATALGYFLEKGTFEIPRTEEPLRDIQVIDLAFAKRLDPNVKDSIGIDAVREIRSFLWQKPDSSRRRTLILDDAELLTTEAQNALLKVTEEPPASSLLIVIASDIDAILPTIVSRLQKVYFGAVSATAIAKWLTDEHGVAAAKAKAFAERALGKPGLALKLATDLPFREGLEQAAVFLNTTPATRKDFIKKLLEPDDFNLRTFLDAVIMNLAWEKPSKAQAALWHRALALYGATTDFGLNPRLQLEALLM